LHHLPPDSSRCYLLTFRLTDLRRPTTLLTFVMTALSFRFAATDFLRLSCDLCRSSSTSSRVRCMVQSGGIPYWMHGVRHRPTFDLDRMVCTGRSAKLSCPFSERSRTLSDSDPPDTMTPVLIASPHSWVFCAVASCLRDRLWIRFAADSAHSGQIHASAHHRARPPERTSLRSRRLEALD
jgi:hypothetical protein